MSAPDHAWIGKPVDRVDGTLKVTGGATYAAETRLPRRPLYGWIVESTIGFGRIMSMDTARAEGAPGVVAVLTHHNAPAQAPYGSPDEAGRFTQSRAMLENDRIRFHGQPVALVVAETLEHARDGAFLVDVSYAEEEGTYVIDGHLDSAVPPETLDGGGDADLVHGDFDSSFADAPVRLDMFFTTPNQHANPMEPHAAVADWDGETLTLYMAVQILASGRTAVATTLRLDPEQVRIVSPFVGGGFGSKLGVHHEAILAALAARALGRPVKVVQSRRQMFANAPHRSESRQRLRLAADSDGHIRAVGHEAWMAMARDYPFAEPAASPSRSSYGTDSLLTRHRVVPADIPMVDSMRAPGEAIGTLALESAIDELAGQLGLDPIDLRLRNEPALDPGTRKPFASRDLARCLEIGAVRFDWADRPARPRNRRDGRWRIGCGVAAAVRPNLLQPAGATVRLGANGGIVARLDMTDIGTGTYTILAQIAAETLGLPLDRVSVELGDTRFPRTSGSGGSFGAGSAGSALRAACLELRRTLAKRATAAGDSPLRGAAPGRITFEDGHLLADGNAIAMTDVLAFDGSDAIEAEGSIEPGDTHDDFAQYSYGAQFAEVGVDADSGEVRLRRMLGVFSAGRILNPKTARSQLIGGMIFGIGGALHEETMLDPRFGAFMNRDLAEYHLPVNRDVPDIDVVMLETPDERSNPLGSKGIGELGICGVGAAIANAVYAASGVRVRDFPITLDKVLAGLTADDQPPKTAR